MKRKIVTLLLAVCTTICLCFGFTACDNTVAVESVKLNKTELAMEIGGEETLTVTVTPDNATEKAVTWTSDNTAVATVESGKVTAVATGTATITAKAGNKSATCSVTVKNSVVFTVTETEWNEALNLKYKNLTFTGEVLNGEDGVLGTLTLKLTEDGSLHQICENLGWSEHIYKVNSDKTVSYFRKTENGWEYRDDSSYDTLEEYEKGNYGDDCGFMLSAIPSLAKYNSSFTFNESDNSYKGTVTVNPSDNVTLTMDVIVKFENKKITYLEASSEGKVYYIFRFYDYGTTEITLPTVS